MNPSTPTSRNTTATTSAAVWTRVRAEATPRSFDLATMGLHLHREPQISLGSDASNVSFLHTAVRYAIAGHSPALRREHVPRKSPVSSKSLSETYRRPSSLIAMPYGSRTPTPAAPGRWP